MLGDCDPFNVVAIQAVEETEEVLSEASREYDSEHWHAALAVYMASAINQPRLEQGMPDATVCYTARSASLRSAAIRLSHKWALSYHEFCALLGYERPAA